MLLHACLALPDTQAREPLVGVLRDAGVEVSDLGAPADLPDTLVERSLDLLAFDGALEGGRLRRLAEAVAHHPDRPALLGILGGDDSRRRAELLGVGCVAVLDVRLPSELLAPPVRAVIGRVHRERLWRSGLLSADVPAVPELPSAAMKELLETAGRVARTDSNLLLLGETGVGKEWMARRIHATSRRRNQPFVAVNCAAVPDSLLESELFGHVRGAFTGAVRSRRGHFERAHGGTLFLDEIGEMSPHLQGKLLRAVQDLEIQRVGAEDSLRVDVRLIAATHRGLEDGGFRSDLYYRLAVVELRLPPLRDRPEDVMPLVEHVLRRKGRSFGRPEVAVAEPVPAVLRSYAWPGNVRELENVVERALVLGDGPTLRVEDLPLELRLGSPDAVPVAVPGRGSTGEADGESWTDLPLRDARQKAVERFERRYLDAALRIEGGRIGATAARIGVDPRSLHTKMRRYGLRKEDYR